MATTLILGFFLIVFFIQNQQQNNQNNKMNKTNYNQNELDEMKKEFWNHQELSWIPNYFRNHELGSGVFDLPNKFLNQDESKFPLITKDNIGGDYYKKTQGYPPIDAVIMWVNGSDPIFQQEKENEYFQYDGCEKNCRYPIESKLSWCCPTRNKKENTIRFTEHDELKYLIRSIEQFAPWIRKIFLVTNNQIPNWLDLSNERIEIVVPSDFVKYPESLPTFSSPALESQLHLIKGLSRLFLYFNDDFFITKPIWPSDFITRDNEYKLRTAWNIPLSDFKLYHFKPLQKTLSEPADIYGESLKYTDTIFDLTFGNTFKNAAPHVPMLIDREIMERIWKEWPNEIEQTARSKFRLGSQMHYQTTFLNYVQNSWIDLNFCNFFYLYFDKNDDKHFNYEEIKKISDEISKLFDTDTDNMFLTISDQIKKELQKKFNEDHDISDNYSNNIQENSRYDNNYIGKHGSENSILDLNTDCEILEKIPSIVEYYNKIINNNNKKLKLYKDVLIQTDDYYFFTASEIEHITMAFEQINELSNLRFLTFNDDFGYTKKSELIDFDKEFHRLANEYWPNKSQFELPNNKLNKKLRIEYS
ncbi:hypothetical protein M0813_11436 [Anaeramoeba flamelloides]|uniref:Uncharacterized protein n=1 Tax=Anaeramoeba flamelloides TaxID=1746091 RepID=A0ABQ8ZF66_9EUKA|nr:hypothetical protein M0813_11436 [Anaeramoeba flamelloides]